MHDNDMVIVSACRTPFGRFGGSLKDIDLYDLSAFIMKASMERINLPMDSVDEVWWGCGDTSNLKDVYTPVVARQSLLKAGMHYKTVSCTFDKACVSAMSAVNYGIRSIKVGEAEVIMGGGAASFSTVPYIARGLRWKGTKAGGLKLVDPISPLQYVDWGPAAVESGDVSVKFNVSREEQDEFAVASHIKYGEAYAAGRFKDEMVPYEISQKKGPAKILDIDEQYRSDIKYEDLAKLPTIWGGKTVTAGNAPGLNDGATAMIVMKRSKAKEMGLTPLATILGMSSIAGVPLELPTAPALGIQKLFKVLDLKIEDMDLVEINEAFACVPLISAKMLADGDLGKYEAIKKRMNVNGGAVAIGHPNTSSGVRIMMHLMYELRRRGGGIGVAAICGGLTQGDAAVIKVE